jgi:pentafunctional AROM polypeptide
MSRILNSTFSPVSHPALPNKAAPGQLSFREIQQALHLLGLLPARRFYLFGTPISQSMSPTLHRTAFNILGLPHTYDLLETQTVGEEIKAAITSPDFGGASVTIPFKLDVIPLLNKLTPAAEAIGAVNSIIPKSAGSGRILVGDNTDWIGIKSCISSKLGNRPVGAALVIGAGGTARAAIYALHSLQAEVIYIYNRTASKARDLAAAFPEARVQALTQLGAWPDARPRVIVSTVPASATAVFDDVEAPTGVISLTNTLFDYRDGPAVVLDMAYRPAETPLLGLAKKVAGENWSVVPGLEVLLEQGYEQFSIWTGRRCPKSRVAEKVWEKYTASA